MQENKLKEDKTYCPECGGGLTEMGCWDDKCYSNKYYIRDMFSKKEKKDANL
jgi:hypothetical protein